MTVTRTDKRRAVSEPLGCTNALPTLGGRQCSSGVTLLPDGDKQMTREIVRAWKRTMRVAALAEGDVQAQRQARESALALLNRSIAFGHGRLAVLRFVAAVRLGAEVPPSCLDHCRAVAEASRDPTLQRLFIAVVEQHSAARGC